MVELEVCIAQTWHLLHAVYGQPLEMSLCFSFPCRVIVTFDLLMQFHPVVCSYTILLCGELRCEFQ
jgi:hypothetical protein